MEHWGASGEEAGLKWKKAPSRQGWHSTGGVVPQVTLTSWVLHAPSQAPGWLWASVPPCSGALASASLVFSCGATAAKSNGPVVQLQANEHLYAPAGHCHCQRACPAAASAKLRPPATEYCHPRSRPYAAALVPEAA